MNQSSNSARRTLPAWVRVTLKLLRFLIVPVLCIGALYVGLYVGYTVVGEQPSDDVLEWSTWKHLYDLVFTD